MSNTRYISCADSAKLVREVLKERFPTVSFSVKSKVYSMGASITIRYVDGPTTREVDALVSRFKGAAFDGMIDLKTDVYHEVNGEKVSYASDYIFAERAYSAAFLLLVGTKLCTDWGYTLPKLIERAGSEPYFERVTDLALHEQRGGLFWSVGDVIMHELHQMSALPDPAVQRSLDDDFEQDYERGEIHEIEPTLDRLRASAEPQRKPYRIAFYQPGTGVNEWIQYHFTADDARAHVLATITHDYGVSARVLDCMELSSPDDPAGFDRDALQLKCKIAELETNNGSELVARLNLTNADALSPLDALALIYELKRLALNS